MNKVSLLLARRYLFSSAYEQTISTMTYICFLGIIIGTFSLSLVTAIMNGFEVTIHEKMQGIHANAIIQSYENPLNVDAVDAVVRAEFPEVTATSPHGIEHAILQAPDSEGTPTVVMLKGIDPERERLVSSIERKLKSDAKLSDVVHTNAILIGQGLAQSLGLNVGDTISLYYLDEITGKRKVTIHDQEAIIGGIFYTGIDEFDNNLVYCSLPFLQQLFPHNSLNRMSISLQKDSDEKAILTQLQNRLNLDVYSWKDMYPALVSALKLEKYAMFFILALITLVASMSIVSLLYMLIMQKRADIAILRAMGASPQTITTIFVLIGTLVSTIATIIGLGLSVVAVWILDTYPFIALPDAYYVSHLPAKLDWHILVIVFCSVMLLSLIATWIPARKTQFISIAQVLRFEG